MQTAVIEYRNSYLAACERNDVWTVRLGNLETRESYLDLALAELLGNASEAHRAAARLLYELEEVVEGQVEARSDVVLVPRRERRRAPRREVWAKTRLLGARALVFAVVAGTAFFLTTWLSAPR